MGSSGLRFSRGRIITCVSTGSQMRTGVGASYGPASVRTGAHLGPQVRVRIGSVQTTV